MAEARPDLPDPAEDQELPTAPSEEDPGPPARTTTRRKLLRLAALLALLGGLFAVGEATGLSEHVTVPTMRDTVESAGPWGYLLFVALFSVGELVHIPGLVFVFAGVLAYGQVEGGILAFVAAVASVSFSFFIVRGVGGQMLAEIERPWFKRIMAQLDHRPVLTVTLLRLVLWFAPPLNYALAMTGIRYRHYVLGSALGLAPIVLVFTLFFDRLIVHFLG